MSLSDIRLQVRLHACARAFNMSVLDFEVHRDRSVIDNDVRHTENKRIL